MTHPPLDSLSIARPYADPQPDGNAAPAPPGAAPESLPHPALAAAPESPGRERVRHAITHDLSETERLVLMLWHAEGMSPDEIAAVLNSTSVHVRALYARTVDRLRRVCRAA